LFVAAPFTVTVLPAFDCVVALLVIGAFTVPPFRFSVLLLMIPVAPSVPPVIDAILLALLLIVIVPVIVAVPPDCA